MLSGLCHGVHNMETHNADTKDGGGNAFKGLGAPLQSEMKTQMKNE